MKSLSRIFWLFAVWYFVHCQPLFAYPLENVPPDRESSVFLLVAEQNTPYPRFINTVILVNRHSNQGHIGIVLNRQHNITLDKLFPSMEGAKNIRLFAGGPVFPKEIFFVVRGGDPVSGVQYISRTTYLSSDLTLLADILRGKQGRSGLRVANGIATWKPGQLEGEIQLGAWFILPLDERIIFDTPHEMIWQELHRRRSRAVK